MKHPLTSIIMPMHNQLEYSKLAIESLYRNTNREEFELICIDDASTDGTSEYLDELYGVNVIHFKENVGFDRGVNAGIKKAKGEYTAILNNDLILTPYWLPQLITVLESDPHIGMVVPLCNCAPNYQQIVAPYSDIQDLDRFARQFNHTDPMRWQERIRLIFYAVLFRTRELKGFGGMDERFSPGGFEDDDLSLRYRRAGYRLIFTTDTYVHHFGSRTMAQTGRELLMRNKQKFYEKHHIHSWDLAEVNLAAVTAYDYPVGESRNLLGVGSRAGATLQYLKAEYMEKRRIKPEFDYLCKDSTYLEDAVTISRDANLYEKRDVLLTEEVKYDLIWFEDVVSENEIEQIQEEYGKYLKMNGDLILLLAFDTKLAENNKEFRLRYQRRIGDTRFCVFTKS
ncbi:glycosyltransferase [Lachnospiraceae bacterium KM106-2]|nr:glycosyltransferase [Lachnospiraceae bacterium KM106-2]